MILRQLRLWCTPAAAQGGMGQWAWPRAQRPFFKGLLERVLEA